MSGAEHGKRKQPRESVKANVLSHTIEDIRQEAQSREVPFMTLVATLLDVIARDKMYDAVLDGEMPRKVGSA